MALSESLIDIALRELDSTVCVCGASKRRTRGFCRDCYFVLPAGLRRGLYLTLSDGYAEAHDECKDWLKINTERIPRC